MRTLKTSLLALVLCGAAGTPLAGAASLRVEAIDKAFDPARGMLSLRLLNGQDKTVTAWLVSVVRVDDRGAGGTTLHGQDAFRGLNRPNAIPGTGGPIAPGETVYIELPLRNAQAPELMGAQAPAQLSVKVIAVLFDDGTYAGNADRAQLMLSARRAEVNELADAVRRLTQIASQSDLLPALRQEAARLERAAAIDAGPESSAPTQVRSALSAVRAMLALSLGELEARGHRGRKPASDHLRDLITQLEEEYRTGLRQLPGASTREGR